MTAAAEAAPTPAEHALRGLPAPGPVVKWAGGKTRLVPEILRRFPPALLADLRRGVGRYVEPFFGGGALFFSVLPAQAYLADANPDLAGMYTVLKRDTERLIAALEEHRKKHSERYFYRMRDRWNDWPLRKGAAGEGARTASVEGAALFLYLNRTCFNGLWRVNALGQFNVPMGRYKSPPICRPEHLRAAAASLSVVEGVWCEDIMTSAIMAREGDVVYLDPPYDPVKPESFTGYTAGGFGVAEQAKLAQMVRTLADRGVNVMASNSDTRVVRDLYKGLRIDRVRAPRAINSRGGDRGDVAEVLVVAGPWARHPLGKPARRTRRRPD